MPGYPISQNNHFGEDLSSTPSTTPLGDVWLDLTTAFAVPMPPLDSDGVAALPIPFVTDPSLRGLELGFQAAVVPNGGAAYLTRLATAILQ